jgi:hypothetical protein
MQMAFLGMSPNSRITAVPMQAEAIRLDSVLVQLTLASDGRQITSINNSSSVVGNWVSPSSSAREWEVRATLTSGEVPSSGTLETWEALTSSRTWSLILASEGSAFSQLTFEFRKVGSTDPEETVPFNVLSAEVTGII